jgi:PadR family transcriptional regulator AphA
MIGEIVQTPAGSYVRCALEDDRISNEQDMLDLLALCGKIDANRIMLDEEHLHPDFFDLRTGLAGGIFQKFSNYHVRAAVVVDLTGITSQRFQELIYECNRGGEIRFFNHLTEAEEWLTA